MIYLLFLLVALVLLEVIWSVVFGITNGLNRSIKITIGSMLVVTICMFLTASKINPPERYTLEETQTALEYVVKNKIRWAKPKHINIRATAEAFFSAQNSFKVPSLLLVSIGYFESKYLLNAIGDDGRSIGIMQVGKKGRRRCREYCGEMKTEHEQIMCGGCWLRENIDWCRTFERGFTGYASGHCRSQHTRTKWAIHSRFELWYTLHAKVRNERI